MARGEHDAAVKTRAVALLFPGQGAQYQRMAAGLYDHEPVFTDAMNAVFAEMGAEGARLRADWLAAEPLVPLEHVTRSQPLLFAVNHALGRVALSWNVKPAAMLGHSIGEVAAATVAGVLDLSSAVHLVIDRVKRLAKGPAGGMLAVAATARELEPYLRDQVVVGAINAPRQTVLAGPRVALGEVEQALRSGGFVCRRTPSSSPFHSPALAPAAGGAEALIATLPVSDPSTVLYSAYTTAPLSMAEFRSITYWARQPVEPVLFWPTLDRLLGSGDFLLVEVGPGQGLTQIARRHSAVQRGNSKVVAMLPAGPGAPENDQASLLAAKATIRATTSSPQRPGELIEVQQ
jgi:acyl transferase domain-containing protein